MLSAVVRCSTSSAVTRAFVRRFASFDPLEAKMAQKKAEVQQAMEVENRGKYATKTDFNQTVQDLRYQGAADAESGQIPTKWQRKFLVITKLYKSDADIPQYVHNGTMNRMHDRMRVVFIVAACLLFFSTFYIAELTMATKIDRDRKAGVVVTKM